MNQVLLSERIQRERSRSGFTQEELARRLGVSKAAVSKWECGQSMPDISLLPKIASLFSITIDQLFGYEPIASEGKREEVRARLLALLGENTAEACGYAEEQSALHWSDAELLRTVSLTLYAKAIEPSASAGADRVETDSGLAELAERILRRTLQLDPDGPSADFTLQALCMLLASEGKDAQAAELVQGMVPGKPSTAAIALAGIGLRTGNFAAAEKALKQQLLFSLLEVASCAQALTGIQSLDMGNLEQLVVLAEGIQAPRGFASLSPALVPIIRLSLATRLAEAGDAARALDELRQFSRDLDGCCDTLSNPQNPPFFDCVQELLWQEGDKGIDAARGDAAATLRATFASRIVSDESLVALRGDPGFDEVLRRLEVKEESL